MTSRLVSGRVWCDGVMACAREASLIVICDSKLV